MAGNYLYRMECSTCTVSLSVFMIKIQYVDFYAEILWINYNDNLLKKNSLYILIASIKRFDTIPGSCLVSYRDWILTIALLDKC